MKKNVLPLLLSILLTICIATTAWANTIQDGSTPNSGTDNSNALEETTISAPCGESANWSYNTSRQTKNVETDYWDVEKSSGGTTTPTEPTTVEQLQTAINNGGTVKLGGSIDLNGTVLTFPENTPVTIDLNGNTLSNSKTSSYVLTLSAGDDVTITGNGTMTKGSGWYFFMNDSGYLKIEGGTYEKPGYNLVYAKGTAVTEITGGTFVLDNIIARQSDDSTAAISGGTYTVSTIATGLWDRGTTVTGGTFSVDPRDFVPNTHTATKSGNVWTVGEQPTEPTTYTVTATANPTTGGTVSGNGEYAADEETTVTATANSGYTFVNWTEDSIEVSTDASYTFTAAANRNLVANFEEDTPVHEHTWSEWVGFTWSDDNSSATATVKCGGCEETKTESVTATITTSGQVTCTTGIMTTWKVSYTMDNGVIKGSEKSRTTTSRLGHDWSEWNTEANQHSRYCKRDGCSETESGDHYFSNPKVEWVVKPESAQVTLECTTCKKTKTEPLEVTQQVTQQPSCTQYKMVKYVADYKGNYVSFETAIADSKTDHKFTDFYLDTVNAENDSIFAKCSNTSCKLNSGTPILTIVAPTDAIYEEGLHHTASILGYTDSVDTHSLEIVYTKDGEVAEPVEVGTYTASVTYEGVTASVTYEVAKNTNPKITGITFNSDSPAYDAETNTFTITKEHPLLITVTGENLTNMKGSKMYYDLYIDDPQEALSYISNTIDNDTEYIAEFDFETWIDWVDDCKSKGKDDTDIVKLRATDEDHTCISEELLLHIVGMKLTITFDSNGGSAVEAITQDYGTTVTAPANPTREGYNFAEWSPAIPATMPAENITITAVWQEKADISINDDVQTYTYDGAVKAFAVDGNVTDGFNVKYAQNGTEVSEPVNAGEYDVIITRGEDGTYKKFETTVTGGLVIAQKSIADAEVGAFAQLTYTGEAQTPTATVTVDNLTVTGTWSDVTNVADTTTFTANGNFTGAIENKTTGMLKANSSVTAPVANTLTYNEAAQELVTAGVANGGTLKYSLDEETWTETVPTATNAESYEVWYKIFGDANHNDTAEAKADVVIAKKSIVDAIVALDGALTYNGEEQTQNVTVILDAFTVTFDVTDNKATNVKADGNYTLKVTANGNFEGEKTLEWNIAKADHIIEDDNIPTASRIRRGNKLSTSTITPAELKDADGNVLGTFSWVTPDDEMTETGDFVKQVKFTPADTTNYNEKTFDVSVNVYRPSSGGGSSSNTTTTTTKNDDGSTTKTTENKTTGTKTEVTTNTDGSTTTVETKKDGTVTTTEKDKEGNTTTTVEKPDGTTVTTEKDTDGTKTVTTENADGSTTTEETKKDGTTIKTETTADGETKSEIDVSANKETQVTIPAPDAANVVSVVITDKNGNKTEITDFEITENGVKISVSSDCTAALGKAARKVFDDVHPVNHWATADVDYTCIKGLMKGTSENIFSPDGAVTRAMLVTVLYRNEGEPATNRSIPFADVDMGAYYGNAVSWAKQIGIVNGISETEFTPNNNITREQIAAIMHRYAEYKGYDVSVGENTNILSYDDFDSISEYAIASIQWAVGSGLIKGTSESTLNPLDNATRAEIAAILHRFIEANK